IRALLASHHKVRPSDLMRFDSRIGSADMRASAYRPLLGLLPRNSELTKRERAAVVLLRSWDGRAYAPGVRGGSSPTGTDPTAVTDGPAATLFAAVRTALHTMLFHSLPADVRARLDTIAAEGHQYDVTPMDN